MKRNHETVNEVYEKPAIEIIEMEMEDGVLLSASSGNGGNYTPGGGSPWS